MSPTSPTINQRNRRTYESPPTLQIFNQTLTYDPRRHQVLKPNGKPLQTTPGHSPSDHIAYVRHKPFDEPYRSQLLAFFNQCITHARQR